MSLQDILQLPANERINLVEQIWDSLNPNEISITTAQKKELDRRIKLHEAGDAEWIDLADLKAKLKQKRK